VFYKFDPLHKILRYKIDFLEWINVGPALLKCCSSFITVLSIINSLIIRYKYCPNRNSKDAHPLEIGSSSSGHKIQDASVGGLWLENQIRCRAAPCNAAPDSFDHFEIHANSNLKVLTCISKWSNEPYFVLRGSGSDSN
jgi:hypothetical protein